MEPKIAEVANRIQSLREDTGLTFQEMADATGLTVVQYEAMESGDQELTFTFLYRCAEKLGVDIVDLLTGESPHLTGYSVVRSGGGLSMRRRAGFEYRNLAPTFKDKLAEPFLVTAPFDATALDAPVQLSRHDGQELDYVLTGRLRFAYESHVEELGPGDTVYYDSGRGHGMIATGGEPCTFLAVVMKDHDAESV
jgi:transcriptional regulator with XRE-family HTH domain